MRAGDEVAPLVGGLVLPLDPRRALDRRGRDQEHLAPPGEGPGPGLGQRHRVALLVGGRRIGVDLVEEQIAGRHRAQADGRVGAGQHQDAAREGLAEHRVAAVARPRRRDAFPQHRARLDQRLDPLLAEPLGQLHRRLHREHRPGGMVDDVSQKVIACLVTSDTPVTAHSCPFSSKRTSPTWTAPMVVQPEAVGSGVSRAGRPSELPS